MDWSMAIEKLILRFQAQIALILQKAYLGLINVRKMIYINSYLHNLDNVEY